MKIDPRKAAMIGVAATTIFTLAGCRAEDNDIPAVYGPDISVEDNKPECVYGPEAMFETPEPSAEVVSGAGAASDVDTKVSDAKDEQDDREFLEKVYREFAAELTPHDKKNPAGDYIAIVDAGMPVLLVTDSIIGGDTGEQEKHMNSAHAYMYAYNYDKEKVEYIGYINSTGSGYPLLVSDGYVIGGFHHSSRKLTVKDGKGEMEEIDGFYLNKKKLTHTVYSVYHGGEDKISKDKIAIKDMNDEDRHDYYGSTLVNEDGTYNDDTYVVFEKLS